MYIRRFRVKNYMCHKETEVVLSPIAVFVGPNAGGKSALFDAILNFSMVARGNIRQAFGPYPFSYAATKFHGALPIERIGFRADMSSCAEAGEHLQYILDYTQQGGGDFGAPGFRITNERLLLQPSNQVIFDRNEPASSPLRKALQYLEEDRGILAALRTAYLAGDADAQDSPYVEVARGISRFNRFRLNPYDLAAPSRLPDVSAESEFAPRIGYQGEDLASSLYYLKETKNPALEVIAERVRKVAPEFQRFEFNFLGPDRVAFLMVFDDARGEIPAVRVSSGLLMYLGLMVLTCSPNRPPVLLIEEPENGLTPTAIREFYAAVHELALRTSVQDRSQVLISSHSPFVICEAWNGEDRDFIHQVKVVDGFSVTRTFAEAIRDAGIVLRTGDQLGLKAAELVMSGYCS
jgi:predicted ATPase